MTRDTLMVNQAPSIELTAPQHTMVSETVGICVAPADVAPIDQSLNGGRVLSFARKAAFASPVVLAGAGGVTAVEAILPSAADASVAAVHRNQAATPTNWSHLGGDPLVRGGINTTHDFVRLVTGKKGHAALKLQGMNTTEIKAADKAARQGKTTDCTMNFGDKFASMVFGINGASIDRNVTFNDPRYEGKGAPAKCLTVNVRDKHGKVTERFKLEAPKKCANLSIVSAVQLHPIKNQTTTKPKETPAGNCNGDVNQANNSGVDAKGGNCAEIINVNTCTANYSPNAIVCSPVVPPAIVTPPADTVPTVNLTGLQHGITGDTVTWCAIPQDLDGLGDLKVDAFGNRVQFSEVGQGEFTTANYPGNDPNEECINEFVGTQAEDQTVTATVTDKAGNSGSDTEIIHIVAAQQCTPGGFDPCLVA